MCIKYFFHHNLQVTPYELSQTKQKSKSSHNLTCISSPSTTLDTCGDQLNERSATLAIDGHHHFLYHKSKSKKQVINMGLKRMSNHSGQSGHSSPLVKMNFVRELLQRSDSDLHVLSQALNEKKGSHGANNGHHHSNQLGPLRSLSGLHLQLPLSTVSSKSNKSSSLLPMSSPQSPTEVNTGKLSKKQSRSRTALNWPFKRLLKSESSVDSGIVSALPSPTNSQARLFGVNLELLCVDNRLPAPVMVSCDLQALLFT